MKLHIPRKAIFKSEFVGRYTAQLNTRRHENIFPACIYSMGPVEVLYNVRPVVLFHHAPVLYKEVGHECETGRCRVSGQQSALKRRKKML